MSEDQYRMESLIEENQKLRTEHRKFDALQSENGKLKELCERMAEGLKAYERAKDSAWIDLRVDEADEALEAYEDFKKGKQ